MSSKLLRFMLSATDILHPACFVIYNIAQVYTVVNTIQQKVLLTNAGRFGIIQLEKTKGVIPMALADEEICFVRINHYNIERNYPDEEKKNM